MGERRCLEGPMKLLNFLLMLLGLAIVGCGIYLLVQWSRAASAGGGGGGNGLLLPVSDSAEMLTLGRPMLLVVSLSGSILDKISGAWFIYLFIGFGAVLFFVSCVGCIAATTKNGCCLSFYSILLILLMLVELGCAAFIFFDHNWKELIPTDKTGDFNKIYDFLKENWNIAKWVALGAIVLEAFLFLLSVIVRGRPTDYDSEEYIAPRYCATRQPLINREGVTATRVPVAGTLNQRPSRNDAWSKRMREKYGLDTSEFSYNPSDPNRLQQAMAPRAERSCCAIM